MMIKAKDPVRKVVTALSSGSNSVGYYLSRGSAVREVIARLREYDYYLDYGGYIKITGDNGRVLVEVHNRDGDCVGHVQFAWYRMPESGNYEFTIYIT